MKAKIDQDMCIRCGMCAGMVPHMFSRDKDGDFHFIKKEAQREDEAALIQVAEDCPVQAIILEK